MSKKRQNGLPYLKSSLKYSWDSANATDEDRLTRLLTDLSKFLSESGFTYTGSPSDTPSVITEKSPLSIGFQNEHGCVGLQNVLDAMFSGKATIALIDYDVISPSAVNMSLGIFAENCSNTTKVYGVTGLNATLAPALKRKTVDAVALFEDSDVGRDIQNVLEAVKTVTPKDELTPAGLHRSMAKGMKRKL